MTSRLMEKMREAQAAAIEHVQGKRTLKTHNVPAVRHVEMTAPRVKKIRGLFNISQAVFARYLGTSTRTFQKWEQGESQPRGAAATLLALVEKNPDLIDKLETVS